VRLFFLRHIFALNFSASDLAHYLFSRRRPHFFDKSRLRRRQYFTKARFAPHAAHRRLF